MAIMSFKEFMNEVQKIFQDYIYEYTGDRTNFNTLKDALNLPRDGVRLVKNYKDDFFLTSDKPIKIDDFTIITKNIYWSRYYGSK